MRKRKSYGGENKQPKHVMAKIQYEIKRDLFIENFE